jgi:SnoaL-like domain
VIGAEDERAIIAVLTRYATGIDSRDWALFRSCFTRDFTGDYPGFGTWHGADEITAFMESAHAPLGATLHRLTNFVIAGDANAAAARCYIDALLMPAEDDGPIHRGIGYYDDVLICADGRWAIQHRRFTAARIV